MQNADHKGHAAASDLAAVNDQNQRAIGQACKQVFDIGQVVAVYCHGVIFEPTLKGGNTAHPFGGSGRFAGNSGQLGLFTPNNATDQSGQRCQMAGRMAFYLGHDSQKGFLYGKITAVIVGHTAPLFSVMRIKNTSWPNHLIFCRAVNRRSKPGTRFNTFSGKIARPKDTCTFCRTFSTPGV